MIVLTFVTQGDAIGLTAFALSGQVIYRSPLLYVYNRYWPPADIPIRTYIEMAHNALVVLLRIFTYYFPSAKIRNFRYTKNLFSTRHKKKPPRRALFRVYGSIAHQTSATTASRIATRRDVVFFIWVMFTIIEKLKVNKYVY